MIENGEITAESIRRLQADWNKAETKTKMDSKRIKRKEFDKLLFTKRHEFLKNGGKVTD